MFLLEVGVFLAELFHQRRQSLVHAYAAKQSYHVFKIIFQAPVGFIDY